MLDCTACGRENSYGNRACDACGQPMAAAGFPLGAPYAAGFGHVCAACEALIPADADACPLCTTPLLIPAPVATPSTPQSTPQRTPQRTPQSTPDPLLSTRPDVAPASAILAPLDVPPNLGPRDLGTAPVASLSSTAAVEHPSHLQSGDTGPITPPLAAQTRQPVALPAMATHEAASPPTPPAPPTQSQPGHAPAPKRSLRGAVLEVPAAPGMALKDGLLLDRDARLDPELSARIARITTPQSLSRPAGSGTAPSMSAHGEMPPPLSPAAPLSPVVPANAGEQVLHGRPLVQALPLPHRRQPAPAMPTASPPSAVAPPAPREAAGSSSPCPKCDTLVPESFLFCGHCGYRMAPSLAVPAPIVEELSPPLAPAPVVPARLVLIKGEGIDGVGYPLSAHEHVAGRTQGMILFPDDRFLSQRQAAFVVRDGRVFLRDEGSLNGVYVRLRAPTELQDGDMFLCGEELLRYEVLTMPRPAELVGEDGTVFYGTPLRDGIGCRVVQVLLGGRMGMVYIPTKPQTLIGREGCDISFPRDRFISGRHTKLEVQGRAFTLHDLGSKNGTYLRIRHERELADGDFVFLGQQLFRVEIGAA